MRARLTASLAACVAAVLFCTALAPIEAAAQSAQGDAKQAKFTIHFEDVALPVFVKFISRATGRNFVFSERVTGNVTVVSPNPVTSEEAFAVFQSVLAVRGLTMIDDGVVTRVVPLKEARTSGAGVVAEAGVQAGYATRLLPLRNVAADDVAKALEPLVSREGALVAYAATNTLIATDTAANLNRMGAVVRQLDVPGNRESVEVIPLEHAEAATIAQHITEILAPVPGRPVSAGGKDKAAALPTLSGPPFRIVADTRTNSLVVTAAPHEVAKIRSLARDLDRPLRAGDSRLHVFYAKYADAQALVDVLQTTLNTRRRPATRAETGGGRNAAPQLQPQGNGGLGSDISISADAPTNAVIVSASTQDYQTIKHLLESLDIPRPQVFVEAIIAEVSVTKARELGFEFQTGADVGDGSALVRSNLSVLAAALNPAALAGIGGLLAAATSDKTVELADGTEIPLHVAVLRALAEDNDIEVLSAPTLLTLDNEEAEILVGQNVPFITGQGTDISQPSNVFTTVERQDIGIKLKVNPQVTEGDVVLLNVEEEVSALVANALLDESEVGPTITIRSAKTTVSVADGSTAVIGGLISDSLSKRDSKIPILGDIPLLGRLFRVDSDRNEKVNLLVILTPHIVRTPRDLDRTSISTKGRFREGIPEDHFDFPDQDGEPRTKPIDDVLDRIDAPAPMEVPGSPAGSDTPVPSAAAIPADRSGRYLIPEPRTSNGGS